MGAVVLEGTLGAIVVEEGMVLLTTGLEVNSCAFAFCTLIDSNTIAPRRTIVKPVTDKRA